jgi:hypothetical protein
MLMRWFGVVLGLWDAETMPERVSVDDSLLGAGRGRDDTLAEAG